MDMLISVGERISCALAEMAIDDLGHEADLAHRLAGRDRHRHDAHEGEDRRGPRAADPRGARRGQDRPRRRLPGRLHRARDHHARPRRLRHDRGRARRRARRRQLRDLHRRRGRLHGRPAHRPGARKLPVVTYEEMLEMAASGAKVMALRSVEFARNHGVRLHVRSTFSESRGHVDPARRTSRCWRRRSSRVSRTTPPRRR